ncbi:hypothetical protein [Pigmentiphaga litoralis]|uniref:hypothetical protein n=1 Tax=Pigmentiphaga litoralis TaxID=516702 RepID=UPI003B42C406
MRFMDFNSWHGVFSTVLGLAVITLIGVGIRVLLMQTVQQRRERINRQINERLKTLIAAYRTLGGSFTGRLSVDPTHLRDIRMAAAPASRNEDARVAQSAGEVAAESSGNAASVALPEPSHGAADDAAEGAAGSAAQEPAPYSSERSRRTRDAVEAALSDIMLLGTVDQVRMAAKAASELASGQPIHTAELVVSLRDFVRSALDLGPIPDDVVIPFQGPTRVQAGGAGRAKGEGGGGGNRGGGGGGGAGAGGGGAGLGMGLGMSRHDSDASA